jgi:WD40 repeat protein
VKELSRFRTKEYYREKSVMIAPRPILRWNRIALLFVIGALTGCNVEKWRFRPAEAQDMAVCSLSFSPTGDVLIAGMYDAAMGNEDYSWYVKNLRQTTVSYETDSGSTGDLVDGVVQSGEWSGFPTPPIGKYACCSAKGYVVAIGGWDGMIRLFDLRTKAFTRKLSSGLPHITTVAFSPDGRTIAAGYRNTCVLLDASSCVEKARIDTPLYIRAVCFDPSSKMIALADQSDRGVECWDLSRMSMSYVAPGFECSVFCLQFSPDGHFLALGGEKETVVWDVRRAMARFRSSDHWVWDVSYAPDGLSLSTVSRNGVSSWDTRTWKNINTIPSATEYRSLSYSPDGRFIATGDTSGTVSLWHLPTGERKWQAHMGIPLRAHGLSLPVLAVGVIALLFLLIAVKLRGRFRRGRLLRSGDHNGIAS